MVISPHNRVVGVEGVRGPPPAAPNPTDNTTMKPHITEEQQVLLNLIEREIRTHNIITKLYTCIVLPTVLCACAYIIYSIS
jgi:hypothetical protein